MTKENNDLRSVDPSVISYIPKIPGILHIPKLTSNQAKDLEVEKQKIEANNICQNIDPGMVFFKPIVADAHTITDVGDEEQKLEAEIAKYLAPKEKNIDLSALDPSIISYEIGNM